ncbi:uncharacterized protein N7446_009136 [Penicillium canescens]|uniref:uncharacterized protein n=1 Tax=Penicillium canescens TaxID=5083 RepID=UPI0026E06530|nr:uncharacterized protein N7446_009136 [Penicillium canescens]KAJ6053124.1 hypothetical protein N7446_009136 [Penicillium canescens]KAJ6165209.1 hypothetical protein N7485_008453 [Penicillium canescens]
MHKHPNKAFILGVGPGFFNWSSTEEEAYAERPELLQVENPQMRDTSVANGPTGPTWMIVRYQVVNPGPFLFHCHIETQMSNAGEDKSPGAQVKLAGQGPPDQSGSSFKPHPNMPIPGGKPTWPPAPERMPASPPMSDCPPHHE